MRPSPCLLLCWLIAGCTAPTPEAVRLEKAYEAVWEHPASVMAILKEMPTVRLSADERALYQLTYSLAAYRTNTENPFRDLSEAATLFRTVGRTDYLSITLVHRAQLLGAEGKYTEALAVLQTIGETALTAAPPRTRSLYHSFHGFLSARSGDYPTALKHYEQSQAISLAEGFDDLTVSNAINLVNLPGSPAADSLESFIEFYAPYVAKALPVQQRKFYNNIGNELKKRGDSLSAMDMYRTALLTDSTVQAVRTQLNYAQMLDHYGHREQAESIYGIVFRHADSTVTQRLYHHLTTRAIEEGNIRQARRYMNLYLSAVNHLYATRDRKVLLEMQARYERANLLHKAERNRNTVLKCLLAFVVISVVIYIIYALSRLYRFYRIADGLDEYCCLMQLYRAAVREKTVCETRQENMGIQYREQLDELTRRISDLMKESNRFRTIYRIRTPHMTVTPEDISALNLFLELTRSKMKYEPSKHRSTLYHWVNLTDDRFAERLATAYPKLSPHDLDLCCFYRMGMDNDRISGLYGQYTDSVRRHRQRLYALLDVSGKESLDLLIHRF